MVYFVSLQFNQMCSGLMDQVWSIANVTPSVAKGYYLTQVVEKDVDDSHQLSAFASMVTQMVLEVATRSILGGPARVEGVRGT